MRLLYFEDAPEDRKRFAKLLSSSSIDVETPEPPANPVEAQSFENRRPDICALDYELTKSHARYSGVTLAAVLRETIPDRPMTLLTRKSLIGSSDAQILRSVFEEVVYKDELEEDAASVRLRLTGLDRGFQRLRSPRRKTWAALLGILCAKRDEADLLLKAGPPLIQPNRARPNSTSQQLTPTWSVVPTAHWIRDIVLTFPGILYDDLHAATALGIDAKSFLLGGVQRYLKSAQYQGVFADAHIRWWRTRLYSLAHNVMASAGLSGPAHLHFAEAFEKRHRVKLRPARCIVSGTSPADCVCYILRRPVKREFSLPYHPDRRPSVMDEARVSFKAIREDNRARDEFFDEQHQKIVKGLQEST
jgi:CheY-like chemotaxis protein